MVAALPSLELEKDRLACMAFSRNNWRTVGTGGAPAPRGDLWRKRLTIRIVHRRHGDRGAGGQWDESERWIRELSEKHAETHATWWYFWCERNGRGDLDTARRLAEKYLAAGIRPPVMKRRTTGCASWCGAVGSWVCRHFAESGHRPETVPRISRGPTGAEFTERTAAQ